VQPDDSTSFATLVSHPRTITVGRMSEFGHASHASPIPSPSASAWLGLAVVRQLSESSHTPSLSASRSVCTQPAPGSYVSVVHASPSSQHPAPEVVPTQVPLTQASVVQGLPSEHVLPSFGVPTQPVAGSHESSVHGLLSLHVIGVCWQPVAPWQVSAVQGLPSSQLIGVQLHWPVAGSQLSVVHALLSVQLIGACWQPVAGSHQPAVHGFPSSWQVSGLKTQPNAGSQNS